ncbi:MAG: hypothetical protein HY842_03585 [Bacteroidetes bacterium]|nr:hypothetical protein [Bacteroidota bacterium]
MKILTSTLNKAARKAMAALLLSSLIFPALFAQSIWTGGAGTTNWNTPGNWTGGVPAAGKTVTIYTCTTCPVITTTGNQASFVQVYAGGKLTIGSSGNLTISNPGGPGLKTHATSQVNISTGASLTIQNFWGEGLAIGGAFNNNGTVGINGGHTGIAVSAGAALANGPTGVINVTGASLNYGLTSSGTVTNQGALTLDDANNDGISQNAGVMNLGGVINITKTGVNAIFSKASINHSGTMTIDNGLNGIYLLFGTFNNNAAGKLTITGTSFLNEGIYVDPGTFKNSGELTIQNALSKGMEISGGSTFNNFNKITLSVPAWAGIFNVGGSNFTNKPCGVIETNAPVVSYATFTNNGVIRESSTGSSQIGMNNGSVINLNGGSFSVSGGNAVIAEGGTIVWTGCSSTSWTDANNWFPTVLPSIQFSKAIVQNVAQASGNAPRVSSAVVSPFLYLHNGANLTIAAGGSLGISDFMLGNGFLEVRQGGMMTVQAGGSFSSSAVSILGGNIQNGGSFNLPATFHSVGSFGMNGGIFNNLSGGSFIGTVGQGGSGVNASLSGGASFTNSGGVTISGFGGFFLNQSVLTNNASGGIGMPSGGRISNLNGSTVTNNGSIGIYNQAPEGIRCESSTFNNGGSITLSFTNIIQYGSTFSNTGSINIASPSADGIINGGTFSSSGNIGVQNSGTHHGILNLNGFTFSTVAGSLTLLDHVSNGVINFGTFSNGGTLDVNTTNFARGIESQGNFVNQTTGKIFIKNTVNEPLANFNSFSNHGTITVENSPNLDGIITGGFFENSVFGKITVSNVNTTNAAGFWVFGGTCNNSGQISTNNTYIGIENAGNLTNLPTGSISLKNAAAPAFNNLGTFINQGDMHLEDSGEGIRNHQIFNSTGDILIEGCYTAGVVNFKQMSNSGSLIVNVSPAHQIVNLGFINLDDQGSASFTNSGNVQIANIQKGMELEGGTTFNNSGSFEIFGDGQMNVGIQNFGTVTNSAPGLFYICCALQQSILNTGGTFTNDVCATVDVDQVMVNTAIFRNKGLLKTTATGSNQNTGSFTNTGVIEDFYGSFNGLPLNNLAVRARPIAGTIGGFIQNALEIGFSNPFQIGTTWYQNANLTNPGGTYIPGVNTFTPSVGVGTHTLYFTAKDLVNNCTKTVSIKVSIASALIGFGGKDEPKILLTNAPNPFSDRTQIKFSLPVDTEAKLVVSDNFGRLVEVVYEGEIIKDELYQFDFNGSDKRVGNYMATLILKNGRTYTVQMVKADNR